MRSSMAGDASAATIRKGQSRKQERSPESARRPAYGDVDGQAPTHEPTGEQNQKQRTFDVLPKPANLISYRQPESHCGRGRDRGARTGSLTGTVRAVPRLGSRRPKQRL